MADHRAARRALGAMATIGVLGLGTMLSACSTSKDDHPAASSTSTAPASVVTLVLDNHSHTISSGVQCTTSASNPTATPAESGLQTTRVHAQDGAANVTLLLSDETPPTLDGFAISLKDGANTYEMPNQSVESAHQVQVVRQDKSYTLTGSGQGVAPGDPAARQMPFGIHVTCP